MAANRSHGHAAGDDARRIRLGVNCHLYLLQEAFGVISEEHDARG